MPFLGITFQYFKLHVLSWLKITCEGYLPKMRIWSILLIKLDVKWCININICIFIILLLGEC